jgi:hypothetical protein
VAIERSRLPLHPPFPALPGESCCADAAVAIYVLFVSSRQIPRFLSSRGVTVAPTSVVYLSPLPERGS